MEKKEAVLGAWGLQPLSETVPCPCEGGTCLLGLLALHASPVLPLCPGEPSFTGARNAPSGTHLPPS